MGPVTPHLKITQSEANVIITWPTNAIGFALQCATNIDSSANWLFVSPDPAIVNGKYTVTNPISGLQGFYRLKNM